MSAELIAGVAEQPFDRPLIFVPNWLEETLSTYKANEKVLKNLDDLLSILIPSDVSFYLSQAASIFSHPAMAPYAGAFQLKDYLNWDESKPWYKNQKYSNKMSDALLRASDANSKYLYDKRGADHPPEAFGVNPNELAQLLGVSPEHAMLDPNFLVLINDMDSEVFTFRIAPISKEQSAIGQMVTQTALNIQCISQYYGFERVMATSIGKCYTELLSANH